MAIVNQNSLQQLLSSDTKRIEHSADVLCHLFRDVLMSRSITLYRWKNVLYPRYMNGEDDSRDPRRDRGNLNNQLAKDSFTWSTFKRAIEFLAPESATFSVVLFFGDDEEGKRYNVILDPKEDESDDYIDDAGIPPDVELNFDEKKLKCSTLNRLFDTIVRDMKISKEQWGTLLDDYVDVMFNVPNEDKRARQRRRNTLDSDLRRKRISWTNFRRGLLLLKANEASFVLEMHWPKERYPTVHALTKLPISRAVTQGE